MITQAAAVCQCECPDCDSMPDHPMHDEGPGRIATDADIAAARRNLQDVTGSPWWSAAILEIAYLAAVRERDELREAALLVLQSQRITRNKRPLALSTALDALRAALKDGASS